MASALTKQKYVCGILFIIVVLVLFSACDPYADSYPFLTEAKWECSDPKMVLEYKKSATGVITERSTLEWNDMFLYIELNFRGDSFVASLASSTHYDGRLFTGTWEYRAGNLVLMIEEDFIFNHTYSELVFVKGTAG